MQNPTKIVFETAVIFPRTNTEKFQETLNKAD